MARRFTLSTALLAGAATLVVAIAVGNSMGNRVLGQIGRQPTVSATPIDAATAGATPAGSQAWKRVSIASVATDPAFPDPRITPPPPPPPPPPTRPPQTPRPEPTPTPAEPTPAASFDYTSPPLPLPLVTDSGLPTSAPLETPVAAPTPESGGRNRATPASRPTPNAVGP